MRPYTIYMTFKELALIDPLLKAIELQGYTHPTPIQEQSIPILLKGNDLLGCAQTGTGKTAAFAIPILQQLYQKIDQRKGRRRINALVITPTRELALQIGESFTHYGRYTGLRNTVIFGGVKQNNQVMALKSGVDVLVATPGRLLDLINQGFIHLNDVEHFVLDEADHMLDMGFVHDIRKVIAQLPIERQSLFFSATMPAEIVALSHKILGDPKKITINPEQTTAEKVGQLAYFVTKPNKPKLLVHLLKEENYESVLVFSRTKHGADKIARVLKKAGITADAIHGNKSQTQRQKTLGSFKKGELKVLVATDIAARGIDVSGLSLVINYDLPNVPETYVHRIGRTGRANAGGESVSFCDREERTYLRAIQKLIDQQIPVIEKHPFIHEEAGDSKEAAPKTRETSNQRKAKRSNQSGDRQRVFATNGENARGGAYNQGRRRNRPARKQN